jgi:glutamate--cysteine ligase
LVKGWSAGQREALLADVPRQALAARIDSRSVLEVTRDMLAIARAGLARRARLDAQGRDETIYLEPLEAIADTGRTSAERLLEALNGPWRGDVRRVFGERRF